MTNMLVIDDDESVCKTLKLIFEDHEYHVDTAHTGGEAILKSKKKFYDVIFIDIRLPDMCGVELLTRLRKILPRTVKIMVTGYSTHENIVESLIKGADAYILKPFEPEELLVILKKQLGLEEEVQRLRMSKEKIVDFVEEKVRMRGLEPAR